MSKTIHLLSPQLKAVRTTIKQAVKGWELPVFGLLGIACLIGCYFAGSYIFGQLVKLDLIAELLMMKVMGFVFQFFLYVLLFSTLLACFSTHYLASDLPLLISAPISTIRLFFARTLSAWAQNSWMVFLFALPTLSACGVEMNAPWYFYIILTLCLLCLTLWCAGIATIVALLLARIFPARRLQEALVILAVSAFLYIYYKFNSSRPDRFFKEDGFEDLLALIKGLRELGSESGVIGWSVRSIFATLQPVEGSMVSMGSRSIFLPLSLLLSSIIGLFAFAGILAKWLYIPGFWLCQEGLGKSGESNARRATPRYASTLLGSLIRREWLIFWRTPSQWTQLLLVGSLSIVYVYNFKYFDTLHSSGFFSTVTLYITHIALTGMVMITLAARFLYPSISVEGKAVWVLQAAPITAHDLLRAKVRWAAWPMMILSTVLSLLGVWFTHLNFLWATVTVWSGWLMTLIVLGLSVGMGAMRPRFNLPNPQMASAGLGGISFMLISLACSALMILMTIPTAMGLMLYQTHIDRSQSVAIGIQAAYDLYHIWPVIGWLGANFVAFLIYRTALRLGSKSLQAALYEDLKVEG